MPKRKSQRSFADKDFENLTITTSDFTAAPAEGTTIESGESVEVFRAEVNEDGDLSSYDTVQLGESLGPTGRSAKGKMFVQLRDESGNVVDENAQFRVLARPKTDADRIELIGWTRHGDVNVSDSEKQLPLQPTTNTQNMPQVVEEGRLIVVEVKHPSQTVEIDLTNSTIKFPARAGY